MAAAAASRFPPELTAEARVAFTLGIVGVPMQMPGHVFNAVLGASQRQDRCTQVWMVSLLGKLIGIAVLLALGFGLAEIMWLETALIVVTGADAGVLRLQRGAAAAGRAGLRHRRDRPPAAPVWAAGCS